MTKPAEAEQLLHLVIGGELRHLDAPVFRDLSKVEFVGAFPNYAEARKAWKARAQATVDNAHMRFFILHAHRMIDPRGDAPEAGAGNLLPD
ncbi:MAG TPA: DUF4170 domain-containing protein [Brevundimonas sp.]|nr:DUF4170 domain-containing protein [Brevundimonas sp.]